jgi:sugar lactone lactonase YvrE
MLPRGVFGRALFPLVLLLLLNRASLAAATQVTRIVGPRPIPFLNGMDLWVGGNALVFDQPTLSGLVRYDLSTGNITILASANDPPQKQLITANEVWIDQPTGDIFVNSVLLNDETRVSPDGAILGRFLGPIEGSEAADVGAFMESGCGMRRGAAPLRFFVGMYTTNPSYPTGVWELDPNGIIPPRFIYGAIGGHVVPGEHGFLAPHNLHFDPQANELYECEYLSGDIWAVNVDAHTARQVFQGRGFATGLEACGFDNDGSFVAAEYFTGRLLRFDPNGPANQTPSVIAQLSPGAHNFAVHPDGRILIANHAFDNVEVVEPNGHVSRLLPNALSLPQQVLPTADGRFIVADEISTAVVDPTVNLDKRITRPWLAADAQFQGVGTTGGCDVYLSNVSNHMLEHADLCHPEIHYQDVLPTPTFGQAGAIASSTTIGGARTSELWVADYVGLVWHVTGLRGSNQASALPLPFAFQRPAGLLLTPEGLYVSESAANRVTLVDPAIGLVKRVLSGFAAPHGLAREKDGSLLVIEGDIGRLTRVRPNGTRETVVNGLATKIKGGPSVALGSQSVGEYFAAGIAVTASGDIYVTTPADGSLIRITSN